MREERYGIALAGGGSKGIYEIGAWEALRDLGVPVHAAVGTSIGSVNAAFMAQGTYDLALEMWQAITVEQCLNLPYDIEFKSADIMSPRNLDVMRDIIRQRGLDTSRFRATIERYIDESAVMSSGIDYGLVTYSLTKMETVEIWRESIHPGMLIDYIMASTHYPGLKGIEIGGQNYLDGGFGDNLPVNMLRRRGFKNIIAIDIRNSSTSRSLKTENIRLTHIRNRLDLGAAFDVTRAVLETNRRLGRLDTLVAFGRIDGDYYYFSYDEYQAMKRFYTYDLLIGLQLAAVLLGVPRDHLTTCDHFITALDAARRAKHLEYEHKRNELKVDSLISMIMKGRFNVPMKLFGAERPAAEALYAMDSRQMWHKRLQ